MLPVGIVSTGFPSVKATCSSIGVEFDPWQNDLNKCILGKTGDGLLAADTVVLSIARQVGKTFDIGALVFAVCIANPKTTVVWTAHRFKVSRETFNELRGLAKSPKLSPHINYSDITTAAGNETIPFRNGSRIVFAARERGAIRGFTKVKILILDEAQILTHAALADLAPTMNQAEDPQIILMGTPPKPTDPGEVFTELRTDALAGDSEGVLYVEFSAEVGSDPDDREAWRTANPSYPSRTSDRAILRLRKLLSDEDFLREALGIWDVTGGKEVIPALKWAECLDPESGMAGVPRFGLDVSPMGDWATIAASGLRADGLPHVEVTSSHGGTVVDDRKGIDWVVPRLADLDSRWDNLVVNIFAGSQAESLKPEIEALGIEVNVIPANKVPVAVGFFYNRATTAGMRHMGQQALTDAVIGAAKRDIGDGVWAWGRRKSALQITGLYAANAALWALMGEDQADVSVFGFDTLDFCDSCGKNPHEDPDGDHDYLCTDCREAE